MESEDEKIAVRCDLASSTLTFRQFLGGIMLIHFDHGDVGRIGQGIDRAESAEKDRNESTSKVKHVGETRMNERTNVRLSSVFIGWDDALWSQTRLIPKLIQLRD